MFGIVFLVLLCCVISGLLQCVNCRTNGRPHIIMIIADDLGSNDLSYRGSSQYLTPNIDALGFNGVIFNRHYTLPICTPSRAALLTGQYPIRVGLQGMPLSAGEDRHLPRNVVTLPQMLKKLGYTTHLVGKWHLGAGRREETPTGKGFDTHFGYWNGYVGYFTYEINSNISGKIVRGFDLKEEFVDDWNDRGKYATDLFTEKTLKLIENQDENTPMFLMVTHLAVHTGDDEMVEVKDAKAMNETFGYIDDIARRRYADAVTQLDKSVGRIIEKLQETCMLNNSVVLFLSDNGAQINGLYKNSGSNYPLRGEKMSLHEGGVRNSGLMYSSLLKKKQNVYDDMIHITDWLPTLYNLAGGNLSDLRNIDGVNQWESISNGKKGQRSEALLNIDERLGSSGIIGGDGRYKLLNGSLYSGLFDRYSSDSTCSTDKKYDTNTILNSAVNTAIKDSNPNNKHLEEDILKQLRKKSSKDRDNSKCKNSKSRENPQICESFCLFDLEEDPCETDNLINQESKTEILSILKNRLSEYWNQITPQNDTFVDVKSDPANYNGTWCTWLDDDACVKTSGIDAQLLKTR